MKTVRRSLSILVSVALLAGCDLFGVKPGAENRVVYRIAASYRGQLLSSYRTVVPGIPSVSSYTLWGTPVEATPLDELLTFGSPSGAEIALDTGTWTFRLEAKDSGNAVLLEETRTGVVVGPAPGTLSFDLKPLASGSGSVYIDISWPSGLPAVPSAVETKITGLNPVIAAYVLDPPLSIAGDSVGLDRSDFAAGEYLIVFKLKDANDKLLTTVSELVRVAPRLTSAAAYALAAGDFNAPPATPTDLFASYGSLSVGLAWTDASNTETGFNLERSADSGSIWTLIASPGSGAVNYTDTAVARGVAYTYRVRSINNFGASAWVTSAETVIPYLLSFDSQGGSAAGSVEVFAGAEIGLPIAPTRTGYAFSGWNTLSDGTGTNYAATAAYAMPAADTTLYARWSPISYTIYYYGNGSDGGTVPSAAAFDFGSTATVAGSGAMTRTGHTFTAWNTLADGNGATYAPNDAFAMPAADVALYAQWSVNNYSLSYDGNGADGGSAPAPADHAYGAQTTTAAASTFTRSGYVFTGWNTAADGSGSGYAAAESFAMPAAAVTLHARWMASSNTISFNANGGSGSMDSLIAATDETIVLTGNAFTRTGFSFAGWNTVAAGSGTAYADGADYTMISAISVTLYAQWAANGYAVAFAVNGGAGSMANQTIAYNATAALTANAFTRTGYSFAGWNTIAGGGGTTYADSANYTMTSTSTVTLYAQWTASPYLVAFAVNGGSGSMANQTIAYNATAALTANVFTRTGYSFAGWNTIAGGGGAGYMDGASYTMASTSTVTLYAQWTANNYDVAFAANGGSGSMANQTIAYAATSALTANALTRTGYSFAGWNTIAGGGGSAYADSANYTMASTSTVTLYAQWKPKSTIGVNIVIVPGDDITVTGPAKVARGATLNASVTQTFAAYGWYLDGEALGLTGQAIELSTGGLELSLHTLMVVTINGSGQRSSAMYRFTVTN